MNLTYENQNILFYLKLGKKLPKTFFHMAANFSLLEITLVPITFSELNNLILEKKNKLKKINMVAFTWNIESLNNLLVSKDSLKIGLLQGTLKLFHLSSFAPSWSEYINTKKVENYFHTALPTSLEQFVFNTALKCKLEQKIVKTWPGGRRAKLPLA